MLADRLAHLRGTDVVVLGLVRGGVAVAAEVARELDAHLDVIVASKVGAPDQPELALGAVARGARVIDTEMAQMLDVSPDELDETAAAAMEKVERYEQRFRGARPPTPVAHRTAIVVDDGLATGATAAAALHALRRAGPERIILAVPVCAPESVERLRSEADEIVCLLRPRGFFAVGQWYEDFRQLEDEEVERLLRDAVRG